MSDQGTEGLFSPYLRKRRIKAALPYVFGRVLDFGCGSGELASYISSDQFLGIDTDDESLSIAIRKHPDHRFQKDLPPVNEQFDTIVSLAVIEHVDNPEAFLFSLAESLTTDPKSRIVLTSPHPIACQIHYLGSQIGLFSRSGNREHRNFLGYNDFLGLALVCDLHLTLYQRFLLGGNQLVVYQREGSHL